MFVKSTEDSEFTLDLMSGLGQKLASGFLPEDPAGFTASPT